MVHSLPACSAEIADHPERHHNCVSGPRSQYGSGTRAALILLRKYSKWYLQALREGKKVEELKEAVSAGKELEITGYLHDSHADRPPGITVEDFKPLTK